jgi:quercetin dioxygenase-like cupin family protein
MKHIRPSDVPKENAAAPIFIGEVSRQSLVTPQMSQDFNVSIVNFDHGARNKFHKHSNDQLLFVTEGTGIVATESEEVEVKEGDVIHVVGGEKHWHGAKPGHDFSHITVTRAGSTTDILE